MTLEEWAQHLWAHGNPEQADYGKQILELFALEEQAEKLTEIQNALDDAARYHNIEEDDPSKIIEDLGRSAELVDECKRRLAKHGLDGADLANQCEDMARTLMDIEETLHRMGGYEITAETDLDLLVIDLCERAATAKPYDL